MTSPLDPQQGSLRSVFDGICELPSLEDPREWTAEESLLFVSGFISYLHSRRDAVIANGEPDSALYRAMSCIRVMTKGTENGLTATTFARFLLCPVVDPDAFRTGLLALNSKYGAEQACKMITLAHVNTVLEIANYKSLRPQLAKDVILLAFEDMSQAPKINAVLRSGTFTAIDDIRERLEETLDIPVPLINGAL